MGQAYIMQACMGEMRNGYKILVSKYEGMRLLWRHSHRFFKIDVDWIHLALDRV
jgi:hypothetical protein